MSGKHQFDALSGDFTCDGVSADLQSVSLPAADFITERLMK